MRELRDRRNVKNKTLGFVLLNNYRLNAVPFGENARLTVSLYMRFEPGGRWLEAVRIGVTDTGRSCKRGANNVSLKR